jgi:broad specificity phosphatase PhoE
VSLEQRDELKEMNVGDFEGLRLRDLASDHSQFFRKWFEDAASVRMPNGENLQEVQERAWAVVEEIAETHNDGSVLLCAHNFVNIMILCKILGVEIAHFRRIGQSVGALNIIERVRGFYSLTCTNDTCHLKGIDLPS